MGYFLVKGRRLMKRPTPLASNHVAPPSVVPLVVPPGLPDMQPSPQPPTHPTCSLIKPIPSSSTFLCGSVIGIRFQLWPPSVVFRIAAAVSFSRDTNPICGVRNWIFQPHSPVRKLIPEFCSL